ncbi:MAG: HIT family protein [Terriglobia bacterium]
MDQLWSPWRFRYVSEETRTEGCIFCAMSARDASHDRETLILDRGRHSFVVLNLYPYTTGHAMIVPYAHVARFTDLDAETLGEMMDVAKKVQVAIESVYHPDGYNLGMNQGRAAGAGVADHVHLHLLPRWIGDANFMTVVGETRLHPEELHTTYDKLAAFLRR